MVGISDVSYAPSSLTVDGEHRRTDMWKLYLPDVEVADTVNPESPNTKTDQLLDTVTALLPDGRRLKVSLSHDLPDASVEDRLLHGKGVAFDDGRLAQVSDGQVSWPVPSYIRFDSEKGNSVLVLDSGTPADGGSPTAPARMPLTAWNDSRLAPYSGRHLYGNAIVAGDHGGLVDYPDYARNLGTPGSVSIAYDTPHTVDNSFIRREVRVCRIDDESRQICATFVTEQGQAPEWWDKKYEDRPFNSLPASALPPGSLDMKPPPSNKN